MPEISILKKLGNDRIDKKRRINIYEADYNFILKYFWPQTSQDNAERKKILETNQFWGRNYQQSHDVSLINELILEYHRITQKSLAIIQHDNKVFFDRTVTNITKIFNQKFEFLKLIVRYEC